MRSLKKLLAVLIVMTMIFGLTVPAFAASSNVYEDEAKTLYGLGLFKGVSTTEYVPNLEARLERQEGAILVLRLFGLEDEANKLTEAEAKAVLENKFSDADAVGAWAVKGVAYAVQRGIIDGRPDGKFAPKDPLLGKEYSKMILAELGQPYDFQTASADLAAISNLSAAEAIKFNDKILIRDDVVGISFATLSATYSNGKTVLQVLSEGNKAIKDKALELGLLQIVAITSTVAPIEIELDGTYELPTKVEIKYSDGSTEEVAVTWNTSDVKVGVAGEYKAVGSVSGFAGKIEVAITVLDTAIEVEKVEAISNTRIRVSLKEEATKADVSLFALVDGEDEAVAIVSAALSNDKKAILLTTDEQTPYTPYTLTVNETDYLYVALPADTTKPTATGAVDTYVSVKVTFSERVEKDMVENVANYKVDNDLTILKAELDKTETIVTLTTSEQTVGVIYELVVSNVADLSGNVMDAATIYFGGMAKDTSKLTITSATVEDYNLVKVVFAKPVDPASGLNVNNYKIDNDLAVLAAQVDSADSTGATILLTTGEQTVGTIYKLTIENVTDKLANGMDKYEGYFGGMAKDLSKPTAIVSVQDSNKVTVTYSKKMDPVTAENVANYSINNDLIVLKAELDKAGKVITLTTSEQVVGTIYTLTIDNVTCALGVKIDKVDTYFGGMAKDTTGPSVSAATGAVNTVTVVFSEKVNPTTASVPTNYSFDKSLGYPTKAVVDTTSDPSGKTVVLTTGPQKAGEVYTLTVINVQDMNGNSMETANDANKRTFIGQATAPAAAVVRYLAASVVNYNTIDLIFDTELKLADLAGLTIALVNTTDKVDVDTISNPRLAESVLVLASNKKVVRVQYSDGASNNPDLFKAGKVYSAQIAGFALLDAPVAANNNNTKNFAGTNVANKAPAVQAVVPVDNTTTKVVFSEAVQGINAATFSLIIDGAANVAPAGVSVAATDVVTEVLLYHAGADATTAGKINKVVLENAFWDAANLIPSAIADSSGNKLTYQFAGTNVENAKPAVQAVVAVDKYNFEIVYSEAVVGALTVGYTVQNTTDGAALDLTGATYAMTSSDTRVLVSLDSTVAELLPGKVYELTVPLGSFVTDLSGLAMDSAKDVTKIFAGTNVPNAKPQISAVSVNATLDVLTVVFSEKVWGVVDETDIILTASGYVAGTPYASITTTDNKTYTITLTAPLDANQIASIKADVSVVDINEQGAVTTAVNFGIQ